MFGRAIEQPKLDVAVSNLRSIWAAERFYYLETGRYGTLSDLAADALASDLVDPTILNGTAFYAYSVALGDGRPVVRRDGGPPAELGLLRGRSRSTRRGTWPATSRTRGRR